MKIIKHSLMYFVTYAMVLAIFYTLLGTGIGQTLFSKQANGSSIEENGRLIGSKFIGQKFKSSKYFFSLPSVTSASGHNALSSSGSNLSLTNPTLQKTYVKRAST
jgi:K+-transporting ATPase ATPase C chain